MTGIEKLAMKAWMEATEYSHVPYERTLYTQGFEDGYTEGRASGIEEMRKMIQKWRDAYPEDIFQPVPKHDEQTDAESDLITRASAQMGRHTSTRLLEDLIALQADISKGEG